MKKCCEKPERDWIWLLNNTSDQVMRYIANLLWFGLIIINSMLAGVALYIYFFENPVLERPIEHNITCEFIKKK